MMRTIGYASQDVRQVVEERLGYFIREKVNPGTLQRDESGASLSPEIFREACQLQLTTFGVSEEIGGAGRDVQSWGRLLEHVGYLCTDSCLPFVCSLRASVIKTIHQSGNDTLIDRYAIPMVYGVRSPAFAYTDGTDAFSFRTVASRTAGGYLLKGEKHYVTGGATADTFMVYARAAASMHNDLQVFLVERQDEGVEVRPLQLAGLRSAGISQLVLRDVFVPRERMLVEADGLSHVQRFLNERRIYLACPVLGRMQAILEDCIEDLDAKQRYGNSLTAMQNVQAQLGSMVMQVETARAMLYRALQRQDSSEFDPFWDPAGCVAKAFVVEQAIALVHTAQRLVGGDGYLRSRHYERYLRDFCGYIPGGGSQDTLAVDLGVHAVATADARRSRAALRAA